MLIFKNMSLFTKNAKTTDLVPAVTFFVPQHGEGGKTTGLSLLWTPLITSLNMLLFCGTFRFVCFKRRVFCKKRAENH
jgi:hypothetical protein